MLDDSQANGNATADADAAARERLSALLDGELGATPVTQACAHWRESVDGRAAWHAYHLIGDVLRSEDLASDPARDAGFLASFRERLASEPVVLAPQPLVEAAVAGGGRRWSWMAPTAAAAGFVAVAGVLVLTRPGLLPDRSVGESVAQIAPAASLAGPATPAATLVSASSRTLEPQGFVATGQVIRDARLDRYLAAHKQFAGSSALGVPSAYLRNATAEVPGR